jgi:hypothetical protein
MSTGAPGGINPFGVEGLGLHPKLGSGSGGPLGEVQVEELPLENPPCARLPHVSPFTPRRDGDPGVEVGGPVGLAQITPRTLGKEGFIAAQLFHETAAPHRLRAAHGETYLLTLFQEEDAQTAQRGLVGGAGTGRAGADDDQVVVHVQVWAGTDVSVPKGEARRLAPSGPLAQPSGSSP